MSVFNIGFKCRFLISKPFLRQCKEFGLTANKNLRLYSQVKAWGLPKKVVCREHENLVTIAKRNSSENTATNKVTIYKGLLARQIKLVKAFSLSTSVIGLAIQPVVLSKMWASNIIATISIGALSSFFIVGTPLLLNWIAKRYVLKVDMNPDSREFSATVLTFLNREKVIDFKASDVVVPEIPAPLATFNVKGKPLFVDSRHFTDISAYKHIMGYDKPIDFHLHKKKSENV